MGLGVVSCFSMFRLRVLAPITHRERVSPFPPSTPLTDMFDMLSCVVVREREGSATVCISKKKEKKKKKSAHL